MHRRLVTVLAMGLLATSAFAGCFGTETGSGDAGAAGVDGSRMPKFTAILYLHPVMFHPYPGGMLSAWVFSESQSPPQTFEPPVFRVKEGQRVEITFINTFDFNHTIHWHGLHVPWEMDGVPYVTQDPVQPGETFVYSFIAKPSGTFFFHCHVDTAHHMDMGMYGVIIVEPANERYPSDSDQILVLDDWDSSHLHQAPGQDPQTQTEMTVDSATDDSGDPLNQGTRTINQVRDTYNDPQYPVVRDAYRQAGGNPARVDRDWYPETFAPWQPIYDTYTINGKSFPDTEPIPLKEGETKRLRLINVGNTIFAMHIHGHHFRVTHTDGYPLDSPYWKDTLLIGPGERYDVMLTGTNPGMWPLHDHNGLHEMNDHISPGGLHTMVVYEGFETEAGPGHDHRAIMGKKAGDFLGLYR